MCILQEHLQSLMNWNLFFYLTDVYHTGRQTLQVQSKVQHKVTRQKCCIFICIFSDKNLRHRFFIPRVPRVCKQGVSPLNSKQAGLKWCLIEKHEEAQLLSLNVNGSKNDRQHSRQPGQDCLAKTYETHKQTHTNRVNMETQTQSQSRWYQLWGGERSNRQIKPRS